MRKVIITAVVVSVLVGGGAFFGGMKYAESKGPRGFSQGNFQNLASLSPEERQQRIQEMGANGGFTGRGGNQGGGFIGGEIISKDEQSVTVKMPDGGSKIIFYSDSTKVSKSVDGTSEDLSIGKNISVTGTQNQDGSVTAQSIQLRLAMIPSQ